MDKLYQDRRGECITFYSYKGGVGRSMAVVNMACLLAKRNKKVLVVDWDVEAPGLHLFFDCNKNKSGLIDLITDIVNYIAIDEPKNNNEEAYTEFFFNNLQNYIDDEIKPLKEDSSLKIDLIKAGKFDNEYSQKLNSINWLDIYQHSPSLFRTFAYYLEKEYDYVLIDSRTGLADSGGITTMLMPQKLVLVFAVNNQNINGVIDIAGQVIDYRRCSNDFRNLHIYPLPSRIENTVAFDLANWIEKYKQKFEGLFSEKYFLEKCDLTPYFDRCAIPYFPIHAHGENIPVLTETTTNPSFISYNYDRFLNVLIKDIPSWEVVSIEQELENDKIINEKLITAIKLQDAGNLIEAIEIYTSIIDYNPNNHLVYCQRGIAYTELRNYDAAKIDFDSSLFLNPSDSAIFFHRGCLREKLEDYQGAISDYSDAIKLNPEYVDAFRNRARAKGMTGDSSGALDDLDAASRLKPRKEMVKRRQPIIVGLDIGTTKVVAIAGRKNDSGKLEIIGFGRADSAGVNHGVVINVEQCTRSIQYAIEACLSSNPILDVKEVYLGIAGQHIKSLQTRGERIRASFGEINREDIARLIHDQQKTYIPAGDQIIDIIPQDYTIDNIGSIIDPIGMVGNKIAANFNIITGDANAIRNIKRCVDKSNLLTRDIVLQPLASAAAVMNDEDLEAGVAIVDIGGGTTDLAVFHDGILKHTAIIPYGGVNITNDIRHGLGVLRTQAEQIKTQFGCALADEVSSKAVITIPGLRGLAPKEIELKHLSHIIQARMQEILDYVMYNLKIAKVDKLLYGGIILTGGGSQLKYINQLTEYVTGLSARIGYPNEYLDLGYSEALMNPMYSTCIGLILRGYHDFETGRFQFSEDGGNVLHILDEAVTASNLAERPDSDASDKKLKSRNEKVKKIFEEFKGKFASMFEDEDNLKTIDSQIQVAEKKEDSLFTDQEKEEKRRFEEQKRSIEERAERLRRMSFNIGSDATDEFENIPAYLRKNLNIGTNFDLNNQNADINTYKKMYNKHSAAFTKNENRILELYFGTDVKGSRKVEEICRLLEVSYTEVQAVKDYAIKRLLAFDSAQ